MSRGKVFCAIISLSMFLGLCNVATAKSVSTDAEMPSQQAQEEDDLKELKNQIRRDKFDLILPKIMRKQNIDMWIHVMRSYLPDTFGGEHLGSKSGVFIFTDRGGGRIERAVLGRRWSGSSGGHRRTLQHKLVEECGAYDIIHEAVYRMEPPGSAMTEHDYRFKGVREFVAKRSPKRIAVNYRETLGAPVGAATRNGISHSDYNLLSKAIGDKYAERLVSSEYLIQAYLSGRVPSESKKVKWVSTDTVRRRARAPLTDEQRELMNQIRREKFDTALPEAMRHNNIDMWIQVLREGIRDPLATDFGSNSGAFIFTDRGGDRIERAVLGLRWKGEGSDLVEKSGDYDIVGEAIERGKMPGGAKSEYNHRFKGVKEFVAKRDPKRIAVNYKENLGQAVTNDNQQNDGISHTDYLLLVKALGYKYAERIVSNEYLLMDYLERTVPSKIALLKMRSRPGRSERSFAKIVPGVTKISDLEGGATIMRPERSSSPADYVFQRGDFVQIGARYAYILREGETKLPPEFKKIWTDSMKMREIMEKYIRLGLTGTEIFETLKREFNKAGFIHNDDQQYDKLLDYTKTQVSLDLHGLSADPLTARIGSQGPDWHHEMTLKPIHHFTTEYFVYWGLPHSKHMSVYLNLWFHDSAYVTERGVEYIIPPQKEIYLIK